MGRLPDDPVERAKAIQDMLEALAGAPIKDLRTAIRSLPERRRAITRELGAFMAAAARA